MKASPIRILLFFTYGVSLNRWNSTGLIDREVLYYQKLVKKHNIKVAFLTYGQGKDVQLAKKYSDIDIIPIYDKIRKPKNRIFRFIQSLFIPLFFRKEIKKADILKTNQMWGSWGSVLSKFIYGKPLIVRSGWDKYYNNMMGFDYSNKYITWLISKISYKLADQIIITSSELKNFIIEKFRIKNKNINIIPNWIDTDSFYPGENVNKILFVGRLSNNKNPELVIDALKNTQMEADIIGDGELKDELIRKIKKTKSKVSILNKVDNKKMPNLYKKYSIYVICSDVEGNPKSLLEAMSCSCAVVGTNVPGIKNIIDHLKTGILVNKDEESLRKALLELSINEKLRVKLGDYARKQIIKNNSLDIILDKEYSIYKKLLKN